MIEIHADQVIDYDNPNSKFLQKQSIRCLQNTKILIVFGHDEAIYASNYFGGFCWTVDVRYALVSKIEGRKVMVSCFCSQEFGLRSFGWGLNLSTA